MKTITALKLSLLFLAVGLGCLVAFQLTGSTIDADGYLQEPFALLPVGWFCLVTGFAFALASLSRSLWRRWSRRSC
ncbi:DUF3955 domain-containing protein [Marinobacterium arenosum]|uniref:DUF3955 domain-containing protein n=1 Tax=Marinobacterium arenosum TaxID=2862496 RepID=UPI001C986EBD|nr:DUF3955 domain-containing protein [Marinobacterium arenosum]MBY4677413.1 DUF3955 domain-containing protein [Marinobacterium arenosum]